MEQKNKIMGKTPDDNTTDAFNKLRETYEDRVLFSAPAIK